MTLPTISSAQPAAHKRKWEDADTATPPPPKKPPATPGLLQHLPGEIHGMVTEYLSQSHVVPYAEALSLQEGASVPARMPIAELQPAREAAAILTAPQLAAALESLSDRLADLPGAFAHRPLMAGLDRLATEAHSMTADQFQDALGALRTMAEQLPEGRRATMQRLLNAIDPTHPAEPQTYPQLAALATEATRLQEQPARAVARQNVLRRIFDTADRDLQNTGAVDAAAMQEALAPLLQRGRPRHGVDGPSADDAQADFLQAAMQQLRAWTRQIAQAPALQRFTGDVLRAACDLPEAQRDRARLTPDEHHELVGAYFDGANPAERAEMFTRLLNALPQAQRGTALADLAGVLPQMPQAHTLTAMTELANRARLLPASAMPENVLLGMAADDVFQNLPQQQVRQGIATLGQAARALHQQGQMTADSLGEIYYELNDLAPLAPADQVQQIRQAIAHARAQAGLQ